jgi:hypothetical protein
MATYPTKHILISPLNDKVGNRFKLLEDYLNIKGSAFHQNSSNPNRLERHYILNDVSVLITEFKNKVDIKMSSYYEDNLLHVKSDLQNILDGNTELF